MAIPFIQKLDSGRRIGIQIQRETTTEELAQDFVDAGGRYLLEIVRGGDKDGQIHVMAIIDTAKGAEKVAEETVPNGRDLPPAIDRLVTNANSHLPPYEMVQRTRLLGPRGQPLA